MRPGDRELVAARAAARGMKPSTYLVSLIHAHLRQSPPLPNGELHALKIAVNELAGVRRQLQLLHCSRGSVIVPPDQITATLRDTLDRVEVVRATVADLVRVNLQSWESADA